jgi:hypothetical protein
LGRLDMVWGTGDEEPLFDELFPRPMKGRILLPGKNKKKHACVWVYIQWNLYLSFSLGVWKRNQFAHIWSFEITTLYICNLGILV